uniref:Uncharacterized protein n=1 Tax=Plectus sambesii TaxID=2011161 RepID=A0A914UPV5_9BILA
MLRWFPHSHHPGDRHATADRMFYSRYPNGGFIPTSKKPTLRKALTPIRAVILTIADPAGLLVVDPAAESDGKIDVIAVGAGLEMIAI